MQLAGGTDRWGGPVADLIVVRSPAGSSSSTAAALLAAGYARVRPEFETRACAAERLAIEDEARLGEQEMARSRLRGGTIVECGGAFADGTANLWWLKARCAGLASGARAFILNSVPRGGPTIVVARKLETAMREQGGRPTRWSDRRSGARGPLEDRFGPRIQVADPAMIEILQGARRSGR